MAELPRDLGVERMCGIQQDAVDLRVRLPLRGVRPEALEVEPRELVPERVIDAAFAGDGDLATRGHDEEVAPEASDRLTRVLFDRHPERVLDLTLLGMRETHQDVVVDELVVAQRLAGRVEAFEDLLCVGAHPEGDRDVLQLLQAAPDARCLLRADLAAEERVVVVEPGFADVAVGRPAVQHHALEDLRPRAMRAQFGARSIGAPHEHALEVARQIGPVRFHRVVERGDQQHERRDALLSVDQNQFGGLAVHAQRGQHRADEMHVTVVGVCHSADVAEELLARADVPPILTLVDGHDDGHLRGGEPGDGVDRGRIDVRGSGHSVASPLGTIVLVLGEPTQAFQLRRASPARLYPRRSHRRSLRRPM